MDVHSFQGGQYPALDPSPPPITTSFVYTALLYFVVGAFVLAYWAVTYPQVEIGATPLGLGISFLVCWAAIYRFCVFCDDG